MTATATLTPYQQGTLDRARALLAQEHGHDLEAMAYRVGALEYRLGDMLALIDSLTAEPE
jgi:hypothetical protein